MKKKLITLGLCILILVGCEPSKSKEDTNLHKNNIETKKPTNLELTQKKLLDEHNKQRKSKGLKELSLDKNLCEYAQKHAEVMVRKNSLHHSQISKLQGQSVGWVGENVAWGQENEKLVVESWMWSPMHRWNILSSNYKKVGFGAAKDKEGRIYWCTVFTD